MLLKRALAAYRLTHLFVYENGPFDIFDWIRHKAGIFVEAEWIVTPLDAKGTQDVVLQETVHAEGFWAGLLICPFCLSVWFAAIVYFLPAFIVDWLSVAGACLFLFKRDASPRADWGES